MSLNFIVYEPLPVSILYIYFAANATEYTVSASDYQFKGKVGETYIFYVRAAVQPHHNSKSISSSSENARYSHPIKSSVNVSGIVTLIKCLMLF